MTPFSNYSLQFIFSCVLKNKWKIYIYIYISTTVCYNILTNLSFARRCRYLGGWRGEGGENLWMLGPVRPGMSLSIRLWDPLLGTIGTLVIISWHYVLILPICVQYHRIRLVLANNDFISLLQRRKMLNLTPASSSRTSHPLIVRRNLWA